MSPGRNDPCPCGSNRKYKKCCLAAAESARPRRFWADEEEDPALAKLGRFLESGEFREDAKAAALLFWGGAFRELPPDVGEEVGKAEQVRAAFQSFLFFDLDVDDGRTVAGTFLERHGARLAPGERAYLEAMAGSCLSIYEATAVSPGEGLTAADLWRAGPPVRIRERSATRQIVPWDLLALRLVEVEPGLHEIHAGIYVYPRASKGALLATLQELRKEFRRNRPSVDETAFLKRQSPVFNELWLDLFKPRPLPKVVTAEGDTMVFARSRYKVGSAEDLRQALGNRADVEPGNEADAWTWHEDDGEGGRRVLAHLRLDRAGLLVDTQSKERAARARAWLEAVPNIRHRATRTQSLERALRRAKPREEAAARPIPLEAQAELMREWKDRHYRKWLDEHIPALGGRTPRRAVGLKTWRPKVAELLKDLEVMEERASRRGQPGYDARWLWEALGLERG